MQIKNLNFETIESIVMNTIEIVQKYKYDLDTSECEEIAIYALPDNFHKVCNLFDYNSLDDNEVSDQGFKTIESHIKSLNSDNKQWFRVGNTLFYQK